MVSCVESYNIPQINLTVSSAPSKRSFLAFMAWEPSTARIESRATCALSDGRRPNRGSTNMLSSINTKEQNAKTSSQSGRAEAKDACRSFMSMATAMY